MINIKGDIKSWYFNYGAVLLSKQESPRFFLGTVTAPLYTCLVTSKYRVDMARSLFGNSILPLQYFVYLGWLTNRYVAKARHSLYRRLR